MKAQDLSRLGNIDQRAITPPPAKGQQVAPARLKAQKVRPAQRSLHEANGLACRLIQSDAEILAVDRQTSVAVDVTEQTAAKTALQNAALDIAERLVPALAR